MINDLTNSNLNHNGKIKVNDYDRPINREVTSKTLKKEIKEKLLSSKLERRMMMRENGDEKWAAGKKEKGSVVTSHDHDNNNDNDDESNLNATGTQLSKKHPNISKSVPKQHFLTPGQC